MGQLDARVKIMSTMIGQVEIDSEDPRKLKQAVYINCNTGTKMEARREKQKDTVQLQSKIIIFLVEDFSGT